MLEKRFNNLLRLVDKMFAFLFVISAEVCLSLLGVVRNLDIFYQLQMQSMIAQVTLMSGTQG
jgi:hypothetical protein